MQSVVICQAEDPQLRGLYSLNLTNGTRKLVWQAEQISFVICRNSVVYLLDSKNEGKLVVLSKTFDKLFETQTYGLGPTHISIDQSGKFLAVTNFFGGSVAIFILDSNGLPSKTLAVLTEVGSGKDNLLQTSSHPQSSVFMPSSTELLVANYGTDVVSFYEVSEEGVKFSRDRSMKYDGGIKNLCLGSGSGNTIVFIKEFDQKLSIVCLNEFKNVTARVLGLGPRTNGQLSLAVSHPSIFIGIE